MGKQGVKFVMTCPKCSRTMDVNVPKDRRRVRCCFCREDFKTKTVTLVKKEEFDARSAVEVRPPAKRNKNHKPARSRA